MIIAMPAPPAGKAPTLSHLKETREIYMRHGFMTYPQFLDNNFIAENKADVKWLIKNLKRFGQGLIQFAVLPDYMTEKSVELKKKWPDINWIYPLHQRDENISDFEWVGFIHDNPRRDHDLKTFFKLTEDKKRWYLGYWDSQDPMVLPLFNGFDTTMPNALAGKYGRIWLGWNKHKSVGTFMIRTNELIEFNVISFKIAIIELYEKQAEQRTLSHFLTNDEKEDE